MSFIKSVSDTFFKNESSLGVISGELPFLEDVEKLTDEFEKVTDRVERQLFGRDIIPRGVIANVAVLLIILFVGGIILRKIK